MFFIKIISHYFKDSIFLNRKLNFIIYYDMVVEKIKDEKGEFWGFWV